MMIYVHGCLKYVHCIPLHCDHTQLQIDPVERNPSKTEENCKILVSVGSPYLNLTSNFLTLSSF